MNNLRQTVCFTLFVLALSINVASAQRDDVEILDPNDSWGMPLPPGVESPFQKWTEGLFFGNFVITNESGTEICWMTMLPNVGDHEIPKEFSIGDETGCLRSGNVINLDYMIDSAICDVYIQFLDESYEIVADGEIDHCDSTYITIH